MNPVLMRITGVSVCVSAILVDTVDPVLITLNLYVDEE